MGMAGLGGVDPWVVPAWERPRQSPLPWLAVALILAAAANAAAQAPATTPVEEQHRWLSPEGAPLPFESDAEVLEFLRTARIASGERIRTGVNRSQKLLLEKDGFRAHAVFRDVEVEKSNARVGDRHYFRFLDSYAHECAAYALARLLGLDNVPPVVLRRVGNRSGSVQIWVENVLDEETDGFAPPDTTAWVQRVWDQELLDNLILNVDRNPGNILPTTDYQLWLIDHTRAFQPLAELLAPERVQRVNRRAWDRLLAMSEEDLRGAVREHLDPGQLAALSERRKLLIAHIQALVDERGEGVIFY